MPTFIKRLIWTLSMCVLLTPAPATAYEIYKDDSTTAQLGGLVRMALIGQNDNPLVDQIGANMLASRLRASVSYEDYGQVFIQYDGVFGLLDAFGELGNENVGVRAGRFKTNASGEFSYPLPVLPTYRRPELALITPRRRVGLDVYGAMELGAVKVRADVGMFNPRAANSIGIDDGQILMERLQVDITPAFLRLHASFVHHIISTNLDPENLQPVFPYDQQLDVAAIFDTGQGTRAIAEFFQVFEGPDETRPRGFYVMGAQVVPMGGIGWEFVLAYDYFDYDTGHDLHRAQVDVNVLVLDRKFVPSLAYATTFRPLDEKVSHTGVLQLQAAF